MISQWMHALFHNVQCWFWNGHNSDYYPVVIIIVGLFATGMHLGVFDMTLGYPGEGPRSNWQNKWHEAIRAKICSVGDYLRGFLATKWDTLCIEGAYKSALTIYAIGWMYLVAGAYFLRFLFRWWAALCAVSGRPTASKTVLIKAGCFSGLWRQRYDNLHQFNRE